VRKQRNCYFGSLRGVAVGPRNDRLRSTPSGRCPSRGLKSKPTVALLIAEQHMRYQGLAP
jgi:hypothetical protein